MHLPEILRESLKKPLGILIKDSETTKENILKSIPHDSFVVTIGDATTEKMIRYGITPSLQIIDGLEKRMKRDLSTSGIKTNFFCTNPPAQITNESVETIKRALKVPPARITVIGEEDLLVLPVCALAPENSIIFYGQPNEGLVIVKINSEIRMKSQSIMNSMSP